MGEGFIVRRGGGGQQTVKPIFNSLTSVGFTSLTLSVTNDSGSIATLYYSVVNTEPAPNQVGTFETEFAGKETKDITITGLTAGTTYTVYLKAIAIGEFPSETVIVPNLTTGVAMNATGGTITEYNLTNSPTKRYRSHTFTGNGTFQVTQLSNISGFNDVDYLIIAGGGGGGGWGGGGGAGGYLTTLGATAGNVANQPKITVTTQSYSVVVGGAGNRGTDGYTQGGNGGNSSVFNVTATGGGGGGAWTSQTGLNGGSGGGGAGTSGLGTGISGQGRNGGAAPGSDSGSPYRGHGGGGGAGALGTNGNQGSQGTTGGPGGNGLDNLLRTGSNETRAGGGGGHSPGQYSSAVAAGGTGGGSAGGRYYVGNGSTSPSPVNAINATANTGGGGGGAWGSSGNNIGTGGSGIVVIRYEIAPTV
jgi:hypothetical protein